jgi:hypothetical protein
MLFPVELSREEANRERHCVTVFAACEVSGGSGLEKSQRRRVATGTVEADMPSGDAVAKPAFEQTTATVSRLGCYRAAASRPRSRARR